MSERRECFCGRRTVFEFGLTDDDGNAHTWRACGKDEDGQGLDVNTLLSERMEQVERAERAEAAIKRVRELHRIVSPHWRPKTLREKLCQQEWSAPDDETREAIARLISTLDRHRPLGSDGKHGGLHTATCGCELDGVMRCQHCGHDYPCPTIRALDGDGDE